jgi:hypothetical protein
MLKVCAATGPDHYYDKETGEDKIVTKAEALADYMEFLSELDEDALILIRTERRLN